ncbi:MAG: class I SAM-dependent methyltransferase [Desulfuromusa sp.]|nr:class I SAM-dependent methyltransferase [Desulfuromusa sp.]
MTHATKRDHWSAIASIWQQVGVPLRPSSDDIGFILDEVAQWSDRKGPPRVLIMGVTPELHDLAWPDGTRLLAVDHTLGMIQAVWPGYPGTALCADWRSLPFREASWDMVVCDGGVTLVDYPSGHIALVETLARVIASGGLCVLRLFTPSRDPEDSHLVLDELLEGKIANLNLLKLRLGMALQHSATEGIAVSDVWNAIHRAVPDFERLAEGIGWPLEHLLAINSYRDSPNRYNFLSVEQVTELFCTDPGGFQLKRLRVPEYELGDRCPTIVLERVDDSGAIQQRPLTGSSSPLR